MNAQEVLRVIEKSPGVHYDRLREIFGEKDLSLVLYALKHGVNRKNLVESVEDESIRGGRSVDRSFYTRVALNESEIAVRLKDIKEYWGLGRLN